MMTPGSENTSSTSDGPELARRCLTPTSPPPHRKLPDRSCATCHRRKIRCNRQAPCAGCIRADIPCIYPSSEQPRRRVRKATIADVASRISDLEKTIVTARESGIRQSTTATVPFHTPHSSPPDVQEQNSLYRESPQNETRTPGGELSSQDILVRNGSSSQYFNELLISQVIEEDQDKSSLLRATHRDKASQDAQSPFNLMGTLSNPAAFTSNNGWQLRKANAMHLWSVFVQTVDPSIKVLHIPTDEISIFTAIEQPEAVPKDVLALVSAVFFSAVVSMDPQHVQVTLGVDQTTALNHFKNRLHQNLADADMLENPTVVLLQAMAIYLTSVRAHNHGRGTWILIGLSIRMAHSIGLHRDGVKLGLSPFESEVRRRLWWHFIARDSRAAEDHGITSWSTVPLYDTKMPLNADDGELRPEMTELPPPHGGWTRMSLPLVCMEIAQMLQDVGELCRAPTGHVSKEAKRLRIFESLQARVQQYVRLSNTVIPLQKMTMQVALSMVYKADFVTRQQLANLESPDKRESFATDENLITVCKYLEIHLNLFVDELQRQYRWCMSGHPQYHMLLYLLWHLCVRPEGPHVAKAWEIVDRTFEIERWRLEEAFSGPGLKSIVLQRLRGKAEQIRDSLATGMDTSGAESRTTETSRETSTSADQTTNIGQTMDENEDWSNIVQNMPDWNTLVGDLQIDLQDFSSYF